MARITDAALDAALSHITSEAVALHICSQEPTTYTQAASTYSLGSSTSVGFAAIANGSPNGRSVTMNAISDGSVDSTGTATHWALVSGDDLLATNSLSPSQVVTSGNDFSIASIVIRMPDAA